VESNPDAYRVKILLLPTAIQAVEEGVVVVVVIEEEELEEEADAKVVVVEEVVVEVHRHLPPHRVRVLQEDEEEVVRIAKKTCNNNWKKFCDVNK